MNIGSLDKRIIFQKYVEVLNEVGETIQELQDYKPAWASVAPVRGREYIEAKKRQPELTYKITVRYRNDITEDMFIKYGKQASDPTKGRVFNILDIIDPLEYHEKLEIMCFEKVYKNV